MDSGFSKKKPGFAAHDWWKWALLPLMVGVIWAAYPGVGPANGFIFEGGSARIILWHLPMALLLIGWFIVSGIWGIRYLRSREIAFDRRSAAAAEVGLLCTILATISGSIWAKLEWQAYWNWDPKQVAIVLVMFIYFGYFVLRSTVEDEEKRARLSAVFAIIGGLAVPFILKLVPQLPVFKSLHPELPLSDPEKITEAYRQLMPIFFPSLLGFLGITTWMVQLRVRWADAVARIEGREEGREGGQPSVTIERPRGPRTGGAPAGAE